MNADRESRRRRRKALCAMLRCKHSFNNLAQSLERVAKEFQEFKKFCDYHEIR